MSYYDPSKDPKGTGTRIAVAVVALTYFALLGVATVRWYLGFGFGV